MVKINTITNVSEGLVKTPRWTPSAKQRPEHGSACGGRRPTKGQEDMQLKKRKTTFSGLLKKSSTMQAFHLKSLRFSGQQCTLAKPSDFADFWLVLSPLEIWVILLCSRSQIEWMRGVMWHLFSSLSSGIKAVAFRFCLGPNEGTGLRMALNIKWNIHIKPSCA